MENWKSLRARVFILFSSAQYLLKNWLFLSGFQTYSLFIQLTISQYYHFRSFSFNFHGKNTRNIGTAHWKFNSHILNDRACYDYLNTQIKMFFQMNDLPETSASLLWKAFNALVRGCLISFQASQNKKNRTKQHELEREISQCWFRKCDCSFYDKNVIKLPLSNIG